jgi:hypothetical protein
MAGPGPWRGTGGMGARFTFHKVFQPVISKCTSLHYGLRVAQVYETGKAPPGARRISGRSRPPRWSSGRAPGPRGPAAPGPACGPGDGGAAGPPATFGRSSGPLASLPAASPHSGPEEEELQEPASSGLLDGSDSSTEWHRCRPVVPGPAGVVVLVHRRRAPSLAGPGCTAPVRRRKAAWAGPGPGGWYPSACR